MKRALLALILIIILLITACNKADTSPFESSEVIGAPTESSNLQQEFKTGGNDFSEKLEYGNLYYYDLDGDEICDTVSLKNDIADDPYWQHPYIEIILGSFPNDPYVFIAPAEECSVWVIDSDPGDSQLEIIETDLGMSFDPESCILTCQRGSNTFNELTGPGVMIDEEHPFSSEEGFAVTFWTDLFGTNLLEGRMRYSYDGHLFRVGEAYTYLDDLQSETYILKRQIDGILINGEATDGVHITLDAGENVHPYETDNESFLILRLDDGRLVRVDIELGDWSVFDDYPELDTIGCPWFINGVLQDLLADMRYSG